MGMQSKQQTLDTIARQIEKCNICRKDKIGVAVPGEGNANADIVFVGEAPGKQEAAKGHPFIGRSGKLLRGILRDSGFAEEDVFITSSVKYLPKRGIPTQADIDHGRIHLLAQLAVIDPKVVVLLGSTACKAVLGEPKKILEEHGKIIKKDGWKCLITIHPAAVLRFPKYKPIMVADFQKLSSLV